MSLRRFPQFGCVAVLFSKKNYKKSILKNVLVKITVIISRFIQLDFIYLHKEIYNSIFLVLHFMFF
jgi:hypothetical protein